MAIWRSDGNIYENEALAQLGMPNNKSVPSDSGVPITKEKPVQLAADTTVQKDLPPWWEEFRQSENVEDRRDDPYDIIKDFSLREPDSPFASALRGLDEILRKQWEAKNRPAKKKNKTSEDAWEGLRFTREGWRMSDNVEDRRGEHDKDPVDLNWGDAYKELYFERSEKDLMEGNVTPTLRKLLMDKPELNAPFPYAEPEDQEEFIKKYGMDAAIKTIDALNEYLKNQPKRKGVIDFREDSIKRNEDLKKRLLERGKPMS